MFDNGFRRPRCNSLGRQNIQDFIVRRKMTKARMFAALSATNEAILRTKVQEELFQRVCDAAVHGGGFKSAAALLVESDGWLRFVAVAGHDGKTPLSNIRISVD